MLQDLNAYLEDRVYLTGHRLTLADALLYYGLHRFVVGTGLGVLSGPCLLSGGRARPWCARLRLSRASPGSWAQLAGVGAALALPAADPKGPVP